MKERPITFVGESVRAILAGQKTQTRRVMKPQPVSLMDAMQYKPCPYGVPGDRLWVRESYRLPEYYTTIPKGEWVERKGRVPVLYENTGNVIAPGPPPHSGSVAFGKLHPSIFMPRWASRITLEITNVRVERVREITEDDAREEGIIIPDYMAGTVRLPHGGAPVLRTSYRSRFADLWDRINAERGYGWDTNPWVWVIEFKRVETKGGV